MRVDFFFDPGCPWCWITSRWLVEVAPQRDVDLHWRSFSLLEKNRDTASADYLEGAATTHRALRVAESLRATGGEPAVGSFYTEVGAQIHHDHVDTIDLHGALQAIGADVEHERAATDERWDEVIRASMAEAVDLARGEIGVPTIAFDQRAAYFGPVITPAPQRHQALELFDALVTMTRMDGFFELKRTRDRKPEFGDRPAAATLAEASPGIA